MVIQWNLQKTNTHIDGVSGKGRLFIILLLFFSAGLHAQFYEWGQDAGNLKWNQLRSSHYRVIYPAGVDSLAQAFTRRLEYFYPYTGNALNHQTSSMPVIIHNEASYSNGVFGWAPKRLEIFTNPDPNGYPQDWLTQLALHEGRHAVQIDKLNQGFTRALYYITGEQGVGAMAVFLPYWYLEGDAVDAETRLSMNGRGRQPSFEMGLKAQILNGGRVFSFSKASLGSYRHYVPNHYELGYLLVRFGRRNYGDQFWIDFQQYAARKPFLLNPTYFSMKRYGFRSKTQFYREALHEYSQHWRLMSAHRENTPMKEWNKKRGKHYTSYTFPGEISEAGVVALKTGLDQIPEFVFMDESGKEKHIFRPGFLSSGRISVSGGHVIWDEYVPDTRWSNRNYSVIRSYDIARRKVKNLGRRTRYYAPDISGDGSRIAAIEQTAEQQFNLVILGMDGSMERKIPSPGNKLIQHPAWMDGDSAVVVILSGEQGKALCQYHLGSGRWRKIVETGRDDISYPDVNGNRIYFSSTFSGIDNIYCYDLKKQQLNQITSVPFGAFYPAISKDGSTLYCSNYSSRGYGIASLPLKDGLWRPFEVAPHHAEQMDYQETVEERRIIEGLKAADTIDYELKPYHKVLHLFHLHSWLPLYVDYLNPTLSLNPEQTVVSPGISLISQNHLSTAVSQVGYEYRNGYHMFHSGVQLKGRYPVLNLYIDYGGEPDVLLVAEGDSVISLPQNIGFTAQSYIPFRFNTGKFLSLFQPRIDYNYRKDVQYDEGTGSYRAGAHYLLYSLYATSYLRKGKRDFVPRLGLTVNGGYYHAPFNEVYGSVASAGLIAYLPGLMKHQTIRFSLYYQQQFPLDMSRPAFINLIAMPRGIRGVFGEVLTRYSADYLFPILYPDLEIGSLLYLKRVRGSVWADYMKGTNVVIMDTNPHYENRDYTTFGVDLITDIHLLRIPFPLAVGGRVYYEQGEERLGFEGIFTIDVN